MKGIAVIPDQTFISPYKSWIGDGWNDPDPFAEFSDDRDYMVIVHLDNPIIKLWGTWIVKLDHEWCNRNYTMRGCKLRAYYSHDVNEAISVAKAIHSCL